MTSGGRLVFANQLRGAAALMVLVLHFTIVVQMMRPDVAWVIGAPPIEGAVAPVAVWLRAMPVDLGTAGVGLFFLISGFVIPISLQGTSAWRFLCARALRIYPVFWVALAIEYGVIRASGGYWHHDVPYAWRDYVVNGLLVETLAGRQTVDWVSWTLSIEAKFYVLAALCRPLLLRGGLSLPLGFAGLALLLNLAVGHGVVRLAREPLSEPVYIVFMLIGSLFYAHYAGRLGTAKLLAGAAAMFLLMVGCWCAGPLANEAVGRCLGLGAGLLVFGLSYAMRARFRPHRVLDAIAAISYPLYLLHAVCGFTVISFLVLAWRVPYEAAAIVALCACLALAALVHLCVERPTAQWGRQIARAAVRRGEPLVGAPLAIRQSDNMAGMIQRREI